MQGGPYTRPCGLAESVAQGPTHRPPRSARFKLVRPSVGKLAVVLLTALICAGTLSASSVALADPGSIAFAPCGEGNDYACGHLTVPLDPSSATPGTITLAIRRHRAPVGNASSAVIALAGGPGQSAIPFAEDFTELLGPILATRDLIVFDQRGTGLSHPLSCHGFEHPGIFHTFGQLISTCASQIGSERGFYTTPDSVADIEAIRRAGGYEKLVLYGTSYGTKVAEQYAQDYPQHVEALILDSVVTPNDPFDRPTFAAVPRILRQLCAYRDCAQITPNPVSDLARLVGRMRRGPGPIQGHVIDSEGHRHTVRISSNDLLGILMEGDFDPLLRAEFIPAVRAAADGDNAPLARLLVHAEGGEGSEGEGIDEPLYYATTCEEEAFPWNRDASPQARLVQATAQLQALPASSFAPFTAANALAFSDIPECAFWPFATPAPPVDDAPLPNVPTLILSGADDLRTPTSGARAVAAQIPDAQLLVVPNTGHSVLTTEPTACAREALLAMFAGKPVAQCRPSPPPPVLHPPPLPPARLADVPPAPGNRGRPGRTLQAVVLTLGDFIRQSELQLLEALGSGGLSKLPSLRSGGLRAGWAQLTAHMLTFHGYSYVPGVTVSGTITSSRLHLRVGGSAAARGEMRLGPHHTLVGTLGGKPVHLARGSSATTGRAARRATGVAAGPVAPWDPIGRLTGALHRLPAWLAELAG
jgi:pimeloyl-ACP methyl ester carboxylesterase